MAKLDSDLAQVAAEHEGTSGVMEEGTYEMTLIEVQTEKNGEPLAGKESGIPYWQWVFKVPTDAPRYAGWQQWVIMSLSEKAVFRVAELFDAFGVPTSTDTDELIGRTALVTVGQRVAQKDVGSVKAGDVQTFVKSVKPLDGVVPVSANGNKSSKKSDKPLY